MGWRSYCVENVKNANQVHRRKNLFALYVQQILIAHTRSIRQGMFFSRENNDLMMDSYLLLSYRKYVTSDYIYLYRVGKNGTQNR